MKTLCIILAAALLAGCGTTSSREHTPMARGTGRVHVFNGNFTNTWRAALNAGNRPPLVIRTHDAAKGYIGAESPARWESWGERVSIWLWTTNSGTAVEVSSQLVGPHFAFHLDWRQPILASIAAELGEPIPPEPPSTVKPARSSKHPFVR